MDPNPAVKLDVVSNQGDPLVWDHSHTHYYNSGGNYHSCSQSHLNPDYEFTQIHPDGTEELEKVYYEDGGQPVGTPETVRAWLTNFDDDAEGKEASSLISGILDLEVPCLVNIGQVGADTGLGNNVLLGRPEGFVAQNLRIVDKLSLIHI